MLGPVWPWRGAGTAHLLHRIQIGPSPEAKGSESDSTAGAPASISCSPSKRIALRRWVRWPCQAPGPLPQRWLPWAGSSGEPGGGQAGQALPPRAGGSWVGALAPRLRATGHGRTPGPGQGLRRAGGTGHGVGAACVCMRVHVYVGSQAPGAGHRAGPVNGAHRGGDSGVGASQVQWWLPGQGMHLGGGQCSWLACVWGSARCGAGLVGQGTSQAQGPIPPPGRAQACGRGRHRVQAQPEDPSLAPVPQQGPCLWVSPGAVVLRCPCSGQHQLGLVGGMGQWALPLRRAAPGCCAQAGWGCSQGHLRGAVGWGGGCLFLWH